MSEEKKKFSAFDAFAQTQQTFAEAEEKAKQEAGAPKVGRLRMGEDGDYSIRILPLAPNFDQEGNILPMERKGYEYPVHQLFLTFKVPTKKGKTNKVSIPIIRTTSKEVGYSVDLIDTYVKIAKELYGDDQELMDLITGNSFGGGLKWNYQHVMMVLDVSSDKERAKGPQLWQCSHSQYKDIDDAKMRLWSKENQKNGRNTCPISGFTDAYPVNIIRKTEKKKTTYTVEIDRDTLNIEEAEAEKLLDLPRIPELVYRYTRYQMEATIEFLRIYDEEHSMEVCKEPDFVEAVEKLKGELPADDTSNFNLKEAGSKSEGKVETTINSLWDEYDAITDQGLGEKSDEYQELREKIRQFIEDNDLDVRISRTKNNQQMLQEVEDALDEKSKQQPKKEAPEEVPDEKPVRTPRPKMKEEDEDEAEETPSEEDEEPVAPRPRRPRPGSQPKEDAEPIKEEENNDSDSEEEETPRRRRRLR